MPAIFPRAGGNITFLTNAAELEADRDPQSWPVVGQKGRRAVTVGNGLDECKTKPASPRGAVSIEPVERIEDATAFAKRDAGAVIGDFKADRIALDLEAKCGRGSARTMGQRVLDQVDQHLPQHPFVAENARDLRRRQHCEGLAIFLRNGSERVGQVGQKLREIKFLEIDPPGM